MFDYLKETTYSNDELVNGEFLSKVLSVISAPEYEPGTTLGTDVELPEDVYNTEEEEPEEVVEDELPQDEEDDEENDPQVLELDQWHKYMLGLDEQERPLRDVRNTVSVGGLPLTNQQFANVPTDIAWLSRKSDKVNLSGLDPSISKYLNTLPEKLRRSIVATSGNDDKHAKNSKHYSSGAIDLRYNDEVYKYMMSDPAFKNSGLRLLNPNHGTAPHLHIEKHQMGGNTLYATTENQQRIGLNNEAYGTAVFPLKGTNVFRGLDNNQPVAVTDGSKYKILIGNQDTAKFKGTVYEKRL